MIDKKNQQGTPALSPSLLFLFFLLLLLVLVLLLLLVPSSPPLVLSLPCSCSPSWLLFDLFYLFL